MQKLLVTVAALALTGGVALAQQQGDQNHQWSGRGGQGHQGGQSQGQNQGQSQGQSQGRQNNGGQNNGGGQWQGRQTQQSSAQQTSSQQSGARPDWNAYYRNNADLQRAYKQNQQSPTYHESIDAFAQRHYQEHGKAEGRALPTTTQPQSQSQNQWREGRWQGNNNNNNDRYRNDNNRNGGDNGNRQRDNRWRSYERNANAQHRYRYRGGEYRWPRGYSYRRWTFGEFLPSLFFGQDYWIYDYSDYGLPYPPPGAAWVRYGPDALLIDRYSGQIIEVLYGVFY